jgi:hypothetical protein
MGKVYNSINVRFIESEQTEKVVWDKAKLAARSVPDDQSSPDPSLSMSVPPMSTDLRATLTRENIPVPKPDPPLPRHSTRDHRPAAECNTALATGDIDDQGEQVILDDIATTIAATPVISTGFVHP